MLATLLVTQLFIQLQSSREIEVIIFCSECSRTSRNQMARWLFCVLKLKEPAKLDELRFLSALSYADDLRTASERRGARNRRREK
jgi:hypothetical protein